MTPTAPQAPAPLEAAGESFAALFEYLAASFDSLDLVPELFRGILDGSVDTRDLFRCEAEAFAADGALGGGSDARLKWRQRGVPPKWRIQILERLMQRSVPISLPDFDTLDLTPGRIAA